MADAVFTATGQTVRLDMQHWNAGSAESPDMQSVAVLERFESGNLVSVAHFGDSAAKTALEAIYSGLQASAITVYAPTTPKSGPTAAVAETIGGEGYTLKIPVDYFTSLPTNGFDFYDEADALVAPGLKIVIADKTQLVLEESLSWDKSAISATATTGEDFSTALAKLTPAAVEAETVSAYYPSTATAIPTIKIDRDTVDADGSLATAYAALNTKLSAYYSDDQGTAASDLNAILASGATADALNALLKSHHAAEANTSLYAFRALDDPAGKTDILFYQGQWVEILTSDVGDSISDFLTDHSLVDSGTSKIKPGLIEFGSFSDKALQAREGKQASVDLKTALDNARFLDDGMVNQWDLGSYLWEVTNQFDTESYKYTVMDDLGKVLASLDYTPTETSGTLNPSDFIIDTSDGKFFFLDAKSEETLALNGVKFSDASGLVIEIGNLAKEVKIDLSAQDYSGASVSFITYGSMGTKLTGKLDTGLEVSLEGDGPLDITAISVDATEWHLDEGATLLATTSQVTAITGDADTRISADAMLTEVKSDSSTENLRLLEGSGDDVVKARADAETFVWNDGDGTDKIINFDLSRDSLKVNGTVVDVTNSDNYTGVDGDRIVGSVTLERPVGSAISPFIVDEVNQGRWGDYVTYEVKVGESVVKALESVDMKVSWNNAEFEYVEGSLYENTSYFPGDGAGDASLSVVNVDGASNGVLRLNSALTPATPPDVAAGTNLFKFMLKRIDPNPDINQIKIDFVNYVDENGAIDVPENSFDFNFVTDEVKLNLETHGGMKAPNPKVYVADGVVMDGLSLVPVATHGDFTQYDVVYNVSKPAGDVPLTDVLMNGNYTLAVEGKIVQGTETDYGVQFRGNSIDSALNAPGISMGDAAKGWSTLGFDRSSLDSPSPAYSAGTTSTTSSTAFSISAQAINFSEYTIGGATTSAFTNGLSDGRYTLGSFIAVNDTDVKFTNTGDNSGSDAKVTISMTDESATSLMSAAGVIKTIDDGSEIYLLGDHWYANPDSYIRAVTAADALEVLKMDAAASDMSGYNNAQIIAGDFDRDGKISSMDAYEILKYSAKVANTGDGSNKPLNGEYMPEWFYVDSIGKVDGTTAKLDPTDIKFDKAIDLFVGATFSIDATAVLVGDVTSSYVPLYEDEDVLVELGKFQGPPSPSGTSPSGTGTASLGSAGNDTLTLADGNADTIKFFGITNGTTGTNTAATFQTADKLDFSSALTSGSIVNSVVSEAFTIDTATALADEGTSIAVADSSIYIMQVANQNTISTVNDLVTALADGGVADAVDVAASADAILIVGGKDTNSTFYVYGVDNDATAAVAVNEVNLLATITTDISNGVADLLPSNFLL